MRLIADRMLRGSAVVADPGQEFDVEAEAAAQLIASGAAHAAPLKVERAVEAPVVERAVEESEVVERVIAPEPVGAPAKAHKRVRKGRKVSGK